VNNIQFENISCFRVSNRSFWRQICFQEKNWVENIILLLILSKFKFDALFMHEKRYFSNCRQITTMSPIVTKLSQTIPQHALFKRYEPRSNRFLFSKLSQTHAILARFCMFCSTKLFQRLILDEELLRLCYWIALLPRSKRLSKAA
jgi:hypothetical protein